MTTQLAHGLRDRVLPMLRYMADEYKGRVPLGYPIITDAPHHATVGIELDPAHSLHFVSEGDQLFADFYYRSSRFDTRSSASREKFGGAPILDRRALPAGITDQALRNLLAELGARFNGRR